MKLGCVSRAELSSLTPIHTQTLSLAFMQQLPAREQVPQGQSERAERRRLTAGDGTSSCSPGLSIQITDTSKVSPFFPNGLCEGISTAE